MGSWYYVNKTSGFSNNHIVHRAGCQFLPGVPARIFPGTFYSASAAIQQAKRLSQRAGLRDLLCYPS